MACVLYTVCMASTHLTCSDTPHDARSLLSNMREFKLTAFSHAWEDCQQERALGIESIRCLMLRPLTNLKNE